MYPSEYAYRDDSVSRAESASAKCRRYPPYADDYTHCDGRQFKLADSNFGREQYRSSDYYVWSAGGDGQLLFIFSLRVSLTTITLHYYSDSDRGLPRLTFYAVPDDFDVWDAPTTSMPHIDIASVLPELAQHRNVSINVDFNMTRKVLMYKYRSRFQFAVSEVEFFICNRTHTSTCKGKCKLFKHIMPNTWKCPLLISLKILLIFSKLTIFTDFTHWSNAINSSRKIL